MAYTKLQGRRAISVVPQDGVIVPSPSDLVAEGTADVLTANSLEDTTAAFAGKVIPGATVYNTTNNTVATVTSVSGTVLGLSSNIFPLGTENYKVYNTNNSEGPVLFVGTGGTLDIVTVGGDRVKLLNIADGSYVPVLVSEVLTATTASDIVALW